MNSQLYTSAFSFCSYVRHDGGCWLSGVLVVGGSGGDCLLFQLQLLEAVNGRTALTPPPGQEPSQIGDAMDRRITGVVFFCFSI